MTYKAALTRSELNKIDYEVATNADRFDKRQFSSYKKASKNLRRIEKEQESSLATVNEFLTDVWSGLYKMTPEVREEVNPHLTVNKKLMEHLLSNESFNQYREYTKLDDLGSIIGTTKYSYAALEWLEEQKQSNEDLKDAINQLQQAMQNQKSDPNSSSDSQNGQGNSQGDEGQLETLKQAQQALQQAMEDALNNSGNKLDQALAKADSEAKADNESVKQLLGDNAGRGKPKPSTISLGERVALAERLTKNKKLKNVAEWAGRFKSIANKKQKSKSSASHAKGGICFGNNVEQLLPTELLLFSQKSTKLDFLRRFSEMETLQFQPKGKQVEGKGPIIVCLDQSGSMRGLDEQAKGFILALIMIAKKQKRDLAYIPFSSELGSVREYTKGKITTNEIINIATNFLDGGTNFHKPLAKAVQFIDKSKFKKADIIFVTDGVANVDAGFQKAFLQKKKDKDFSMLSVIIGSSNSADGVLKVLSDKLVLASDFTNDNVVNSVFTI
ncbi:VWA domain-containing protein [Lysinibacillus fusiformis]|uniref:vWA domain-containing protein n=1 Tax=Lysinibacillus fusiformis TaxID=28031 RepID=UPI002E1CD473|nr:VWA domain-containing protein [Lysinibacillus fusiformis]